MSTSFILGFLATCGIGFSAFLLLNEFKNKIATQKREQESARRIYELAILREVGDRIGYSLDVKQIIDIITSSLHQFIEYAAVSYMLVEPERIIFKTHLERSVDKSFVADVKSRMIESLSRHLGRDIQEDAMEEIQSGAIILDQSSPPVRSYYDIPLAIGEKAVGLLTVADVREGLYKEEEMTILTKLIQQASKAVTRLQTVVKSEQEKVNAMVASMEDGVVMTDSNYRILVINPAAKRIIGKEDKAEVTLFDFIDNLGGKLDMRGQLEEAVKLKKSYVSDRFEIRGKFYQCSVFPVKTGATSAAGDVLGGVVIFHDVTREVELERVREDFTSMIVHELRTPLSGIQKSSELLKSPAKKQAAQTKKFVDIIYQNSTGMIDLVNDILDAAKLQAGKFEVISMPADIAEIVENRISFFEISSQERHIKLRSALPKDLPTDIPMDGQRIKQVLNNLISNSIKFTPDGGSVTVSAFMHDPTVPVAGEITKLRIKLPAKFPEDLPTETKSLVVIVCDTGVGIANEHIPRLFSKFQQLNAVSFSASGRSTGLGLAIAKGIIDGHSGKIGAISEVGHGSAFYFVLPYGDKLNKSA